MFLCPRINPSYLFALFLGITLKYNQKHVYYQIRPSSCHMEELRTSNSLLWSTPASPGLGLRFQSTDSEQRSHLGFDLEKGD